MENKTIDIEELLTIMRLLRDRQRGCPWDIKQSFQSIAPHTLEEVYEVLECIESGDYEHLPNELGDLLFQIVFYAQMGSEQGLFGFDDIVDEISRKLLSRHPHVFPDGTIDSFGRESRLTPEQVEANWERIKETERSRKSAGEAGSVFDGVPAALPAMLRATKIQGRAANVGFDWDEPARVLDKLKEEIGELEEGLASGDRSAVEEELGDVFFTLINLARQLKIDPESGLREANRKFERRFREMETRCHADGRQLSDCSLDELERLWQEVKRESPA